MPAILRQAVAGKRPSRPFRPPKQGDSKRVRLPLLWNGSSQGLLSPLIETHLKQSMAHPAEHTICTHNWSRGDVTDKIWQSDISRVWNISFTQTFRSRYKIPLASGKKQVLKIFMSTGSFYCRGNLGDRQGGLDFSKWQQSELFLYKTARTIHIVQSCDDLFSKATWLSILLARDSQIANADLVCADLDIEKDRDCFRKIATISAPNHLPLWKKARTVSARQMIWGFPTFMVRRRPFLMDSHSRRHQLLHPRWFRRANGSRAGDHLNRELNVLQLFPADRLTSSWSLSLGRMIHRTSNDWLDGSPDHAQHY